MTGTELKVIVPAATEVLGPEVDRLATPVAKLRGARIASARR